MSVVAVIICSVFQESEVSLPGVDEMRTATVETANKQYQYETRAMLEKTLQEQYGEARRSLTISRP